MRSGIFDPAQPPSTRAAGVTRGRSHAYFAHSIRTLRRLNSRRPESRLPCGGSGGRKLHEIPVWPVVRVCCFAGSGIWVGPPCWRGRWCRFNLAVVAPAGDHCLPLASRFRLARNKGCRIESAFDRTGIGLVAAKRLRRKEGSAVPLEPVFAWHVRSGVDGRPPCRSEHPDRGAFPIVMATCLRTSRHLANRRNSSTAGSHLAASASLSFRKCLRRQRSLLGQSSNRQRGLRHACDCLAIAASGQ